MLTLPAELTRLYETLLTQQGITMEHRPHYRKWLRYYWDFCHKYGLEPRQRQSFPPFDEKLRVRHQSDFQRHQAHHAVSLYYEWVLTDPDGGQRLKVPSNGSENSPVDATGSIPPPAGTATTASPVRPLIARERTPRKDGKPLRSLHPQPPPNAPSPQARKPIDLPSATLERHAQALPQAISKDPITQFKNVTLRRKFLSSGPGVNLELLAVAGAVESVESVFYFPSGLRESAKRLLFLSPRQSPQRANGVTFLHCATIYPRVTF